MARRVIVVGGGVTGLSTAYRLGREGGVAVTLLESAPRLGGNIVTERRDGFTLDGGPDSWVATKPHATALARELGLDGELVPTVEATRRVYVAWRGTLHAVPEGLILAVPTRITPVLESRLFSWGAKVRMGMEVFVPRSKAGDEDESIGDFVRRRLGREVTERLAAPLLGGIFAGDAASLSMRATFPQLVDMEQKHGSLIRAMRAARKAQPPGKKPPSAFLSLRGGMEGLVRALGANLAGVQIETGAQVRAVARLPDGDSRGRYELSVAGRPSRFADDVVLAVPAWSAADALRPLDAPTADLLAGIPYLSTATVFLAFRRADVDHPLDAVGFIVPREQGRPMLAATWVSSKWDHRAPEGSVLMRAFFGGAWGEGDLARDDVGLAALALEEMRRWMHLKGDPIFTRVFRFTRASAQPLVGHLTRMKGVRERLARWPGLYVGGNGYDGIGIPDCVKQGEEIARSILGSNTPDR
jgi:protoporphyrinogen/coproporphyrinogen III oxidase